MKEKYYLLTILLLLCSFVKAQDCITQRTMSNDTSICQGQSTTISLFNSELNVWYQLRNGATNIGSPVLGNGNTLNFNVSPSTTTTYSIFVVACGITYNDDCTISVNPIPDVVATNSNQTICSGSNINPISLSSSVLGTTFNWVRDNTTSVIGISNNGTGNITGNLVNTTTNAQTVTFTITPIANGCLGNSITANVLVEPVTQGGNVYVTAPGVTPTSNIFTHCHVGNGTLYLTNYVGNIVRWEYSTNAGLNWTPISNTSNTYNYNGILTSTLFRAVVQSGSGCTILNSTSSMINVIPNIKPSPVVATPSTICNGQSSVLTAESGYATSQYLASGGTFQNANPPGWLVDGCGNCLNAGTSNTNPNPWQLSASNGGTYSGTKYSSQGKFLIANGNFNSIVETPVFNTFGLSTAQLTFNQAFVLKAGARARVEISVNGGAYNTLLSYTGPINRTPTINFNNGVLETIDLSNYIGQPNLRIRFFYEGTNGSSWAIDNVQIPDVPTNLQTQWVDSVNGTIISNATSLTVSPSVTTTYAITSYLNGCNSFGTDGTAYVTVYVNERPTAAISQDQYVCMNGTANFSVNLTGAAPWTLTYNNGTTSTTINNIMSSPYTFSVPNMTTTTTYTLTALDDNKCTAIASDFDSHATVTVLDGTQGVWTGLISSDWFDCRNWERGLPTLTVDAVIPNTASNMPIIDPLTSPYAASYSNIAQARNLIINSGSTLTMTANSNLEISADWRNSGTFYPGQGNVTFLGAQANQVQTINQGINLQEKFYDLTLNNGGTAKGVSVADNFNLTVSNILNLINGDLRLVNDAQLIQEGTIANPSTGNGKLLVDQQGTKSSYHYNYWCSPVNRNGVNYTIGSVLFDGTNAATSPFNPGPISYGSGYNYADGALTSPIKISTRWLYKYSAMNQDYYNWQAIYTGGTVKIGEGYIMKGVTGTAAFTEQQNYTFKGIPNNGNINLTIAPDQIYLIGNPYASALDANQFILDNIRDNGGNASNNVINGALYFWDHFGAQTHYLAQYVGGYATYTLMGGVVAVSNDPLINNNNQTGTKIPKRYIPVAQGFFVKAFVDNDLVANNPNLTSSVTGGTISIKNSQRVFERESGSNSVFFRTTDINATSTNSADTRMKIRLGVETDNGFRRQVLLGVDPNATNQFDLGYDAPMIDVQDDDFYFSINNVPFSIDAINSIDATTDIPVTIKLTNAQSTTIKIDTLENIDSNLDIFLYDNVNNTYTDLRQNVTLTLGQGLYSNRFSIRFTNSTLSENDIEINDGNLNVFVNNNENTLQIKNNTTSLTIKDITIYNLLGQVVNTWHVENSSQNELSLKIGTISTGTYIVKLNSNKKDFSHKVYIGN